MSPINGITVGILLFLIGVYGIIVRQNLIKIVLCLGVLYLGLILFFVSIGYVEGGAAPILGDFSSYADPLPQTLMLTTVVVELSTTALALALIMKVYEKYKTVNVRELK